MAIKKDWIVGQDYNSTKEKLTNLRKRLVVNQIATPLTVDTYETHAKIALEVSDLDTFIQCFPVLVSLYKRGLPGHVQEFTAYSILYHLSMKQKDQYEKIIGSILTNDLKHEAIDHAIQTCKAVEAGKYKELFGLYLKSPNLNECLLEPLIPQMRLTAIKQILAKHKTCPITALTTELNFKNEEECSTFLTEHKYSIQYGCLVRPPKPPKNTNKE
uniref:SAC3/GANP/THP3 conserved domain-containing protein n=1 Tax=Arcella intermedia TaxID=1963864 RepID=A0A6B2LHM2_9EUKA